MSLSELHRGRPSYSSCPGYTAAGRRGRLTRLWWKDESFSRESVLQAHRGGPLGVSYGKARSFLLCLVERVYGFEHEGRVGVLSVTHTGPSPSVHTLGSFVTGNGPGDSPAARQTSFSLSARRQLKRREGSRKPGRFWHSQLQEKIPALPAPRKATPISSLRYAT